MDDCRGQTYDNAANMAGKYSGVQARVLETNGRAVFIPCMAHSLNLVGISAVESCVEAVTFFGCIQKLYTFFSASSLRWQFLKEKLTGCGGSGSHGIYLPKRLNDTRWSAHAEAVKSLSVHYDAYIELLQTIADSPEQKAQVREEALSLCKCLRRL